MIRQQSKPSNLWWILYVVLFIAAMVMIYFSFSKFISSNIIDTEKAFDLLHNSIGTFDTNAMQAGQLLQRIDKKNETMNMLLGDIVRFNLLENNDDALKRPSGKQLKTITEYYRNALVGDDDVVRDGYERIQDGFIVRRAKEFTRKFEPVFLQEGLVQDLQDLQHVAAQKEQQIIQDIKDNAEISPVAALESTKTFTSDSQNVHDTGVKLGLLKKIKHLHNLSIHDGLEIIPFENCKAGILEFVRKGFYEELDDNKIARLEKSLEILANPDAYSAVLDTTPRDVFCMVYMRSNADIQVERKNLIKRAIVESCIDMVSEDLKNHVCVMGRIERIMESLTMIDTDALLNTSPLTSEMLRNEVISLCAKIFSEMDQQRGNMTDEEFETCVKRRWNIEVFDNYDERFEENDFISLKRYTNHTMSSNRTVIIDKDKCNPKKCRQECRKSCPVVCLGKLCIEVSNAKKLAYISEDLCIGCGICVKRCPFNALRVVNLPSELDDCVVHRYSANSFKLHRLPTPRLGSVLGLIGTNGIGKTTALKILSGIIEPNLGHVLSPPSYDDILKYFRGSELQNYFKLVKNNNFKVAMKPQYVDTIPSSFSGSVHAFLERTVDPKIPYEDIELSLDLQRIRDRDISRLSGGELQRLAIASVVYQDAHVYMFDEPSSYLDIKQRLNAANVIRSLTAKNVYTIVVEHDLSILDYLSDYICCLYGTQSVYGVVTMPFSVREGINIFLDGIIPTENIKFRDESVSFKISDTVDDMDREHMKHYTYPYIEKACGEFQITIEPGEFSDSEIVVLLGENGTGKSTFMRMLAGSLQPDNDTKVPEMRISYKTQKINPKFQNTVRMLFLKKIQSMFMNPLFKSDVMKPLKLDSILDCNVQNLSGGELQRVAICLCLGTPADVYLIDEPSAYLDAEQRLVAAKVIKRFILHERKSAFVVEHDFIMATYIADQVIVFDGTPGYKATASKPQTLLTGMNSFLESLNVTFRKDQDNFRPRINKLESTKDREQKLTGNYFFV